MTTAGQPAPRVARVHRVVDAFTAARDPELASAMAAYMRNQFPFLGIPAGPRVALLREALDPRVTGRPEAADVEHFVQAMWVRPEREFAYAGQWFARRHVRLLDGSFLATARTLITTRPWWDTVDELAQNVVGPIVLADRSALDPVIDEWAASDDLWLARTAILHQNRWKERTDVDRLFRQCLAQAAHPDFFLRKAIGWALRELSKTDPDAVRGFVAEHESELSPLSRKEALLWLDRRARSLEDPHAR